MGGTKYNRMMKNPLFYKYKNSLSLATTKSRHDGADATKFKYLQESIIPTYHFQKSLPKLPIPKLEDTCERYLNALKPVLNNGEYERTKAITKIFEKNEGAELDREIRANDAKQRHSNYISDSWFDMYLSARDPIVLNYNPFIAFVSDPRPEFMTQTLRTTNFLIAAMRFMNSMRANKLEPEIFHLDPEKSNTQLFKRLMRLLPESVSFYGAYMFNAYPLDMSQYFRLFNSTRIPKKGKDVLFTDSTQKHILIIKKGHYFVFPVIDDSGNILPPSRILACVDHIVKMSLNDAEHPLGVLTAENRDTWAAVREKIEKSGNAKQLELIDSALFCISLDDVNQTDNDLLSHNFLHGNPKNRWFDKSISLFVTENAHAAVNFEHSWGDGVAVLRFFTEIFADVGRNPHVTPQTKPDTGFDINKTVQKLEFNLTDDVKSAIGQANTNYQSAVGRLKIKNFEIQNFGKSFVKKYKLSPDSIMQTAFQTAFYRMYNKTVATYESASTSAFKLGRTETIRPATVHTKKFTELFSSNKASNSELMSILSDCSKLHGKLTKEAAMGQGFDRHLFAMRYLAAKKGQNLPELFHDSAYKLINNNILSTSTLAHPTVLLGGFAPVVPDGYGIGYRMLDNSLGACVTSYEEKDARAFVECLEDTFKKLQTLLKESKPRD